MWKRLTVLNPLCYFSWNKSFLSVMFYVYQTHLIKIFNLPNKASLTYFSYLWVVTICLSLSMIWRNLKVLHVATRSSTVLMALVCLIWRTTHAVGLLTDSFHSRRISPSMQDFAICYCGLSSFWGQPWSTVKVYMKAALSVCISSVTRLRDVRVE